MTMLPPSVQAHKRGPSSHVCGQVYLDLPGSAQISLDMDTKIWEAKFPDLLKRALPRQTPYLSPKKFISIKIAGCEADTQGYKTCYFLWQTAKWFGSYDFSTRPANTLIEMPFLMSHQAHCEGHPLQEGGLKLGDLTLLA